MCPGPAVVTSVATSGLAACLGGRHRGLRGALICLPDKASAA